MQQRNLRNRPANTERVTGHSSIGAIFTVLLSTAFLTGCPEGSLELPATDPDNKSPVAVAGPDQSVDNLTLVNLDGSGSSDADGDTLSYWWTFESAPEGSIAELMSPLPVDPPVDPRTLVNPNFMPDVIGEYVLSLHVDDGFDATDTDTVTIIAEDPGTQPPVANAGPNQNITFVQQGTTVQLDGRLSSDPDNDPLSFSWEIVEFVPSGALDPQVPVVLIGPNTENPVFDVIAIDQLGEYTIQLTVSDGVLENTDTVVVIVAKTFPPAVVFLGSGLLVGAFVGVRRKRRQSWSD